MLKHRFGGTIHIINKPNVCGVTWQVTSNESFAKIKKAAQRVKTGLPREFQDQLFAFLNTFDYKAKPGHN